MLQARRLATGHSRFPGFILELTMPRYLARFTLRDAGLPEYCPDRMIHFGAREIVASVSAAALIFCCSCDKHRVGEDPEVQKEKEGNGAAANKAEVVETPAAKRTPAEFFRAQSPSPSP